MSRVAVTGLATFSAAGIDGASFLSALEAGRSLGMAESTPTLRGRSRELRVARLASFDRQAWLAPSRLRRMSELSQVWTIGCLAARADAGLEGPAGQAVHAPSRRGVFLGTGLGCIDATWEYLQGLCRDGAAQASPLLFSESVSNAPAGHSAIELDAQGASETLTCGDASAAAAVAAGLRAVRDRRVDVAYCGGVELLLEPVLRVLGGIGAPRFLGEGCACLVLEPLEAARTRGARVHAELAGVAMASDPACSAAEWSRRIEPIAGVLRAANAAAGSSTVDRVFLHVSGAPAAREAERGAALSVWPQVEPAWASRVFGDFAAAGGLGLAAAVRCASRTPGAATVALASAWGGGLFALTARAQHH